jgi:WD40 repeat protein
MQQEADLFFGRDRQSDDLVQRLGSRRFLAVVGTSGSGKSSLVRAGLLPSLEAGFLASAGAHWRMAILRAQDDPIGFLTRAIVETGSLAHLGIGPAAAAGVIEATLRRSSLGLVEAARQARLQPHENLLILVDQFEELFRFADLASKRGAGDEAPAFVKLLLEAARQTAVPIYVVITMRSDFLGDCARFRDLPEAISDSQYLIPRLTRDELQAAITGPIGVRGGRIAPALVQHLLNDVGDDMDQLPILQHALMRAWDHWERHDPESRAIDLNDLTAIGGMAQALSRHADEAFGVLTTDRERTVAERLFKGLTERGADNREIRRPTPLARIAAIANVDVCDVRAVIEVFRAPGRSFLMPPHDVPLDHDSIVDISHESLIRQWGRLRTWVEEEAESRATYLRLVEAARLRREGKAGLWGEPDLTYARQWQEREAPNVTWAERYGPGFAEAHAFLRDSEKEHAAELENEKQRAEADRIAKERELEHAKALAEAQRQRADEQTAARARQRRLSWALFGLLALAAGTAMYAWQVRGEAEEKRREAENQSALSLSRQLAMQANNESRGLPLPLLFGAAAYAAAPTTDARQTLQRQLEAHPRLSSVLSAHRDFALSVAFSPDGKTLASASLDGVVILWDLESRTPLGEPLKSHTGAVFSVAFSPDGKTLASGGEDTAVILWDVAKRARLGEPLKGHYTRVVSVAFSPDGKSLASASDGRIRSSVSNPDMAVVLWDVESRKPVSEPLQVAVRSVAFSPDGKTLASAGGGVVLFDVTSRRPAPQQVTGLGSLNSVAFSPDGSTLAFAHISGNVLLWDLAKRTLSATLVSHVRAARSVVFSPDGKMLASASEDGTVILWDLAIRSPLGKPLTGHKDAVFTLAFSPDGRTLASAGADHNVLLWDVARPTALGDLLRDHQGEVFGVAFSPDSKMLASAGDDKTVVLSEVASRRPPERLEGHKKEVFSVAFSPAGKILASASADGAVILWDLASRTSLGESLKGHTGAVISVAFSPDGKIIASAGEDKTVRLWDLASRAAEGQPLEGHQQEVMSVAFSPDGKVLASASLDKTVILWSMITRKPTGKPLDAHHDRVSSVAFSRDGKTLASASADGAVILWDLASRKPLGEPLKGHTGVVFSIAFSPDGKTLASAGEDTAVILWDVARRPSLGEPLKGHERSVNRVAFSPDGKTLASASTDGVILWDVDVGSWMRKACAIANRNLTHLEWAQYVGDDVPYRAPCPEFPVPKQ